MVVEVSEMQIHPRSSESASSVLGSGKWVFQQTLKWLMPTHAWEPLNCSTYFGVGLSIKKYFQKLLIGYEALEWVAYFTFRSSYTYLKIGTATISALVIAGLLKDFNSSA